MKNSQEIYMKIAVIGAGYMGSALTFPFSESRNKVSLVGTKYDDWIISECINGNVHPKLKNKISYDVYIHYFSDFEKVFKEADIAVIAVLSEGFTDIFKLVSDTVSEDTIILSATKGFIKDSSGIKRISEKAAEIYYDKFKKPISWATIGGPVKAVELSNFIPTGSIYASNKRISDSLLAGFSTDYYKVSNSFDITGVELCSALKNVYSIALGICDGMYKGCRGDYFDNIKAFLFTKASEEMSKIVTAAGGLAETVHGLAGTGDLYVTSQSGRNRKYGEYLGKGTDPVNAFENMAKNDEFVEGYLTTKFAFQYVKDNFPDLARGLPLLEIINNIIFNGKKCSNELKTLFKT